MQPLQVGVVGEVLASENLDFAIGDLVNGNLVNLCEYFEIHGGNR